MFAKLYGTDDDQVLVMLDTNQDGDPCVRFSCKPEGVGVCTFSMGWDDTDDGWDKAEQYFANVDEEKARQIVSDTTLSLLAPSKEG